MSSTLRDLLDADEVALALPVRLELWTGTTKADRPACRRAFSALPLLVPSEHLKAAPNNPMNWIGIR